MSLFNLVVIKDVIEDIIFSYELDWNIVTEIKLNPFDFFDDLKTEKSIFPISDYLCGVKVTLSLDIALGFIEVKIKKALKDVKRGELINLRNKNSSLLAKGVDE